MKQKAFDKLASEKMGKHFRLIGCTLVFKAVHFKMVAGFIPALTGHTLDGTRQTQPRIADIIWL